MLWLRQIQLFFCNHSNMRKSCLIWCSHRTRAWMCFVKRLWSHQCCSSCLATNIKDVDFPRGKPQFSLIKINMPERSWDGSSRGSPGKQHRDGTVSIIQSNFLLTFKKNCINNSPKKVEITWPLWIYILIIADGFIGGCVRCVTKQQSIKKSCVMIKLN